MMHINYWMSSRKQGRLSIDTEAVAGQLYFITARGFQGTCQDNGALINIIGQRSLRRNTFKTIMEACQCALRRIHWKYKQTSVLHGELYEAQWEQYWGLRHSRRGNIPSARSHDLEQQQGVAFLQGHLSSLEYHLHLNVTWLTFSSQTSEAREGWEPVTGSLHMRRSILRRD